MSAPLIEITMTEHTTTTVQLTAEQLMQLNLPNDLASLRDLLDSDEGPQTVFEAIDALPDSQTEYAVTERRIEAEPHELSQLLS